MTATFPVSVPTTAGLRGNLVDNLATFIGAGGLTAGGTTITVDDTTGFPSAGLASIRKANATGGVELFSYTGKTATTFTGVTRNFNSRYNAAWAEDDVVELYWVADFHNRHVEETIAIGQNISDRFGLGASSIVVPSGVSFALRATTNQMVLGTTNTTTINATAPAASRVYTIPDAGGAASFVMTAGAQTIAGVTTFSSVIKGADGTSSAPGFTFGTTTIGMFKNGSRVGLAAPTGGGVSFFENGSELLRFEGNNFSPLTTNQLDIGATSLRWKSAYFAGNVDASGQVITGIGSTSAPGLRLGAANDGLYVSGSGGTTSLGAVCRGVSIWTTNSAGFFIALSTETQSLANSGGKVYRLIENTSNTASSAAELQIGVGGTSASDATIQMYVSGGSTFTIGVDNDDSDNLVISCATTLGGALRAKFESGGPVSLYANNVLALRTVESGGATSVQFAAGGGNTAPTITFAGRTTTGITANSGATLGFCIPSGANFSWYEGGTEVFRWDGGGDTLSPDGLTTKTADMGTSAKAWDDVWADDFQNVADIPFFDYRKGPNGEEMAIDDLAIVRAIKPQRDKSGKLMYDPNGHAFWDDSTLPDWLWTRGKHHGGQITRDPEGKPWISMKVLAGLALGAVGQLTKEVDDLKATVESLKNKGRQ